LLVAWPTLASAGESEPFLQEVVIGVQTLRPPEQTRADWQPTADYLSRQWPGYRFRVEALNTEQLTQAVAGGRLDFVLTNPSHYVALEASHRVRRIATLVNAVGGHALHQFGGVILVHADRHPEIRGLADLKGRRIAAVGPSWLGGYHVQAAELQRAGIDPERDLSIYFRGEPQDAVVMDVAAGRAAAGFVRTGIIEELAREGRIRLADFRILNVQSRPGFPLRLSTQLYPEWPFSACPHADSELAGRVAVALLGMASTEPAARRGGYYGWTIPDDYQAVHGLMRELHQPPYDGPQRFSLWDVVRQYEAAIFATLVAALLFALFVIGRFQRLNQVIQSQLGDIRWHAGELEREAAARAEAEGQLHLAASVFEHSNDGIVIADAQGRILEVNAAFSRVTGYSREEALGRNPRMLQSGRHDRAFYQAMWKMIEEQGHWQGEIWNRRKSGEFYVELLDITAIRNPAGEIVRYVGVFSDVTDLRQSQDKLEQLAHFDALTHLPNRVLLADRLQQAIAQAERSGHLLAVCFLDLDGFKPINDNYGHHIGDKLLIEIAARLKAKLRGVDTVARLGGDEFVLLITDVKDVEEMEQTVSRVIEAIESPCRIGELELAVSASIGVSLYPLDQAEPELLIRHADQAMYMAKRAGRGRFKLFDSREDRLVEARMQELERLHAALRDGEFVLHFQPRVDMRAGRVLAVEALIRWQHPSLGLLLPAKFLPLAEHDPIIIEIGRWVLAQALDQLQAWLRAGLDIKVSVNVAARQLQWPGFVEDLRLQLLQHPEVHPGRLELEILESAALEDVTGMHDVINACRVMGVDFALDDFGTGYASLSYLKRLPVDVVKIDQTFIRELLDNSEDLAIVEGIVSLARIFRLRVVGEGVETPEHGVMLMRLGCDQAQGYGIARPMPAAEVAGWCRRFQPDPQWSIWADVPWDYADFPLLVAQSEHYRWIKQITRYVEGESPYLEMREVEDNHHCRFGRWYYGEGQQRYGKLAEFIEIEAIHEQVHRIGHEILDLMADDQVQTARARLPQLMEQRDRILMRLCALQMLVTGQRLPAGERVDWLADVPQGLRHPPK
jgi:diguanylate cyclase (GGDEF)-like protein/PAS domain S-box-containing protein